jgi:hypothetical protein
MRGQIRENSRTEKREFKDREESARKENKTEHRE